MIKIIIRTLWKNRILTGFYSGEATGTKTKFLEKGFPHNIGFYHVRGMGSAYPLIFTKTLVD